LGHRDNLDNLDDEYRGWGIGDNLDDDEDEFGAEDGSPPPPAGGGADMQPDPTRATRDEAWDQHIVPILQRCPKQ
jgi:hypothetical protein